MATKLKFSSQEQKGMFMRAEAKCPYCGKLNSVLVEDGRYFQRQIITCDFDQDGCDKDFVVDTVVTITTESKKIEGEEEG